MTREERIIASETHTFKVVFPDQANHHNTMFGGKVLLMMTETAFMTAARFSRKNFVFVSCEKVDFAHPIPAATMAEFVGKVESVGNKSIKIRVNVFKETIKEDGRLLVANGLFTMVAVDEAMKPIPVERKTS